MQNQINIDDYDDGIEVYDLTLQDLLELDNLLNLAVVPLPDRWADFHKTLKKYIADNMAKAS